MLTLDIQFDDESKNLTEIETGVHLKICANFHVKLSILWELCLYMIRFIKLMGGK